MSGLAIFSALLLTAASPAKVFIRDKGAAPKYEFEGDVVKKAALDTNRDGKHDRWDHYDKKGRLARVELDTDHDGKGDFRSVIDEKSGPRPTGPRLLQLMKVKGRYRFVPAEIFRFRNYQVIPGRAEKLVKGKWTGTFTYRTGVCVGASPITSAKEYAGVTVNYVDGLPTRVVVSRGKYHAIYRETTFKDGLPVRSISGRSKKRITEVRTYRKGIVVREEKDTNGDGKMDVRIDYSHKTPPHRRTFVLKDGKWTGTYVKKGKPHKWQGHTFRQERHFRDGVLLKDETIEVKTGKLKRRNSYKDGHQVFSETDRDLDGVIDFRTRYGSGGNQYTSDTRLLKDGKWVRDFVLEDKRARTTYKDGKVVRIEHSLKKDGKYTGWLIVCVGGKEWHSGRNGKIETWQYYSKGRLVREKRDTDGDGKPDMEIDYDKLTITRIPGGK